MKHIHPVHLGWLAWLSCLSVIFLNVVQRICKSMPKSFRIQIAQQPGHEYQDCPASFAPSQNSCKPPKQLVPPRNDSDPGPGLSADSQRPADTLDSLCRLQPRQLPSSDAVHTQRSVSVCLHPIPRRLTARAAPCFCHLPPVMADLGTAAELLAVDFELDRRRFPAPARDLK
jgi:hypothetical protein